SLTAKNLRRMTTIAIATTTQHQQKLLPNNATYEERTITLLKCGLDVYNNNNSKQQQHNNTTTTTTETNTSTIVLPLLSELLKASAICGSTFRFATSADRYRPSARRFSNPPTM
ncbi:unnamed protein product, partial [Ceratitis capitata]